MISTQSSVSSEQTLFPFSTSIVTPDPPRVVALQGRGLNYVIQAGDTLYNIASANSVSLQTLQELNNLENPDALSIGQVIRLPELPLETTSNFKIMPDGRFVYGPGSRDFNIHEFIDQQPGYIRVAAEEVDGKLLSAGEIIEQIALQFSIDPRLLMSLLEYESNWFSSINLNEQQQSYPLVSPLDVTGAEVSGIFRQLSWVANQLNHGYYGWKYRGFLDIELTDGERLLYWPGLNAGTVGVYHLLNLIHETQDWHQSISPDGFYRTYVNYFGNPFLSAFDPLFPPQLGEPELTLPFAVGETWFYTGGPHGGWGSGSAWSAIDFAPPNDSNDDSACYISSFWARAVAQGVIARSDSGIVTLDLDNDGNEGTGWVIFYLHLAADERVPKDRRVQVGDPLGHPSCEGGVSNATHLHIARKYNGEWIPAFCHECDSQHSRPPFTMSGWSVVGLQNQEYQGFLLRGESQLQAEQSSTFEGNRIFH